jgi:hypothetical protein
MLGSMSMNASITYSSVTVDVVLDLPEAVQPPVARGERRRGNGG